MLGKLCLQRRCYSRYDIVVYTHRGISLLPVGVIKNSNSAVNYHQPIALLCFVVDLDSNLRGDYTAKNRRRFSYL